jgi:hypothetical protein
VSGVTPEGEERLLGGNVSGAVVRVGATVRRPAGPWTAGVDALLVHLEAVGFEGAPRFLGYDEQGRQVLSYTAGHTDADPADLDAAALGRVGRLIREFHDASQSFVPPEGAAWQVAITPDREELIVHHDLAPWNLVRSPAQMVIIDWDGAGPGSRLWDVAYAMHGFVPLSGRGQRSERVVAARVAVLAEGYGLSEAQRVDLVPLLGPRTRSMYDLLRRGHEGGIEPWRMLWETGHGQIWLEDAEYIDARQRLWAAALGL